MKRCVYFALILVLLSGPASVFADSSDRLTLNAANVTAASDELVVLLNVTNSQNLEALDIPLEYSDNATLEKVEFTDRVSRFEFQVASIDNQKHRVLIGLVNMGADNGTPDLAPGSGEIAKLYFRFSGDIRDLEINSFESKYPDHSLAWYYNDYTPGASAVRSIQPEMVNALFRVHGEALPNTYDLKQNTPNPFNPDTDIQYALPHSGDVRLSVFNILGQNVRVLIDDYQEAGIYTVVWDGKDALGEPVASGIYFYQLKTGEYEKTRKMVLLK